MKGDIIVTEPGNAKRNKTVTFKNNAPFNNCISKINSVKIDNAEDLNTVKITEKQQKACGIITEMSQVTLFLLILNLLNARQILQVIFTMLVMVKLVMMQTKLVKI